jgi:hypothetical protein
MKYFLKTLIILILISIILVIYTNYYKIPSKIQHINRNKYNVFPVGQLRYIKDNEYIDNNGIIWKKRTFLTSILHNPFKYYVFETYDTNKISSSEVEVLKKDFDNGYQIFKPSSYNYYSSFNYPLSHLFSDILPIIIYLRPKYRIYNKIYNSPV